MQPDYAETSSLQVEYVPFIMPGREAEIEEARTAGNAHLNSGNIQKAIAAYTKGISLFSMDEREGQVEISTPTILLTTLLANRSLAYVKCGNYENALYDSRAIIIHRPDWVKGHFRQGEAYFGLRLFDKAVEAFNRAGRIHPNDDIIKNRIRLAQIFLSDNGNGLEIHQLVPGRDICHSSIFAPIQSIIFEKVAIPMRNFIYLIADKRTRQCVVFDACWDIDGILKYAKEKRLEIVAAIISHYHVDHCGGIPPPPFDSYRVRVDGIARLKYLIPDIQIFAHEVEIANIITTNPELDPSIITSTKTGFKFSLPLLSDWPSMTSNGTTFEFYHTPGHTPGSQCVLVNRKRLFSGDTLFISSCGRVDFPDSCKKAMFNSLQVTLAELMDDVVVFPGHDYGGMYTTIGDERRRGLLQEMTEEEFDIKV